MYSAKTLSDESLNALSKLCLVYFSDSHDEKTVRRIEYLLLNLPALHRYKDGFLRSLVSQMKSRHQWPVDMTHHLSAKVIQIMALCVQTDGNFFFADGFVKSKVTALVNGKDFLSDDPTLYKALLEKMSTVQDITSVHASFTSIGTLSSGNRSDPAIFNGVSDNDMKPYLLKMLSRRGLQSVTLNVHYIEGIVKALWGKNLVHLSLTSCPLSKAEVKKLQSFKQLESLYIDRMKAVDFESARKLSCKTVLPKLTEFYWSEEDYHGPDIEKATASFAHLKWKTCECEPVCLFELKWIGHFAILIHSIKLPIVLLMMGIQNLTTENKLEVERLYTKYRVELREYQMFRSDIITAGNCILTGSFHKFRKISCNLEFVSVLLKDQHHVHIDSIQVHDSAALITADDILVIRQLLEMSGGVEELVLAWEGLTVEQVEQILQGHTVHKLAMTYLHHTQMEALGDKFPAVQFKTIYKPQGMWGRALGRF